MTAGKVTVVGAGVIGLTTAVVAAEAGHEVEVIADQIPGATSHAAGASWGPYLVEPKRKVAQWSAHTLAYLTELSDVAQSGVRLVSGIEASRTASSVPDWALGLPGIGRCEPDELPPGFTGGWRYTTPTVDMPPYLQYLVGRAHAAGVTIINRHIESFDEFPSNDLIVNCTGMGAKSLANDRTLYPIRGQLVVVKNPGIEEFFSEDTGSSPNLLHYLPHGDQLVLGGVAITHDYTRAHEETITQAILQRCAGIAPQLANAKVLEVRIGYRPTRPQVRLDFEDRNGLRRNAQNLWIES